jgi:hypothetical protein
MLLDFDRLASDGLGIVRVEGRMLDEWQAPAEGLSILNLVLRFSLEYVVPLISRRMDTSAATFQLSAPSRVSDLQVRQCGPQ